MKFVTQDYYEILNLEPGADSEDVKRAYRSVRQSFRPDSVAVNSLYSEEESEAICSKIDEAFSLLSERESSRRYRRYHRTGRVGAPVSQDPEAFFDEVHRVDGPSPIEELATSLRKRRPLGEGQSPSIEEASASPARATETLEPIPGHSPKLRPEEQSLPTSEVPTPSSAEPPAPAHQGGSQASRRSGPRPGLFQRRGGPITGPITTGPIGLGRRNRGPKASAMPAQAELPLSPVRPKAPNRAQSIGLSASPTESLITSLEEVIGESEEVGTTSLVTLHGVSPVSEVSRPAVSALPAAPAGSLPALRVSASPSARLSPGARGRGEPAGTPEPRTTQRLSQAATAEKLAPIPEPSRRWDREPTRPRTNTSGSLGVEALSDDRLSLLRQEHNGVSGPYLHAVRVELGVSLEDISCRTKISMGMLLAIENEVIDDLPARVYLKGYLNQISRLLQLPRPTTADRYLSRLGC